MDVVTVISVVGLNVGLLLFMVWIGRGLRSGRRIDGATVIMVLSIMGCILRVSLGLSGNYDRSLYVYLFDIVYSSWMAYTLVAVVRIRFSDDALSAPSARSTEDDCK